MEARKGILTLAREAREAREARANSNPANAAKQSTASGEEKSVAGPGGPVADGRVAPFENRNIPGSLFTIKQGKTLVNGDCFYSSIYRGAEKRGWIGRIEGCLGLEKSTSEKQFIQNLRNRIADSLTPENSLYQEFKSQYDFAHLDARDSEHYGKQLDRPENQVQMQEQLQNYKTTLREQQPAWFASSFDTMIVSQAAFIAGLQNGIRVMTNWVSDIEIGVTRNLLFTLCRILLKAPFYTENFNKRIVLPSDENGIDILYIYNPGNHWEYIELVRAATPEEIHISNQERWRDATGSQLREVNAVAPAAAPVAAPAAAPVAAPAAAPVVKENENFKLQTLIKEFTPLKKEPRKVWYLALTSEEKALFKPYLMSLVKKGGRITQKVDRRPRSKSVHNELSKHRRPIKTRGRRS